MKQKIYMLAVALVLALTSPVVMAKETKSAKALLTTEQQIRLEEITRRVEEIKSIDRSSLTREERKELRNELVEMKKEAKAVSGGVYLSVGAIVIIILLLILLL
ncbi:MAG TPA: hypothetical protein VNI52_11595 [Sphingobacteriaceae bacterium]|nr:hypothetical protein [Sphingobacteriaceae bacterium]